MGDPKLKKSKVDFVLVSVRGDSAELSERIGGIVALAEANGARSEVAGGIVMATYGISLDNEKGDHQPKRLLDALKRGYPSDTKILYGAEVGHSGFLVGQKHIAYNIFLPHLTKARHRVHELNWGEVLEFNPKENNASPSRCT
jgi:hypothetical protein